MTTCIALLRGINVGGHNLVLMAALRAFLSDLGFADVRTLLQSGNAVFRTDVLELSALERRLETKAAIRLGVRCDFVVRAAAQWDALIKANPFADEAKCDPGHLVVTCLKAAPATDAVDALRAAIKGPEVIHASGCQLYVYYPTNIGHSRLTNNVIERSLAIRGTARNWNTVLKLATLIAQLECTS